MDRPLPEAAQLARDGGRIDRMSAESRAQITADIVARTGIDEAMIERLVRGFYAKVR